MEQEQRRYYICDPNKNVGCKKRTCSYDPEAEFRVCNRTSDVAFAKLDANGLPIRADLQQSQPEQPA